MSQQDITFSVYQLVIEGHRNYNLSDFSSIVPTILDNFSIPGENNTSEVLWVQHITKTELINRYVFFCFNKGTKYPYPPKVITPELTETDNPRRPEQIEPNDEFFVLIDTSTKRIYISNARKRNEFANWLQEKLRIPTSIKAIMRREEFIDRIRKINKLSFSVVPNLLTLASDETLTKELAESAYGFDAERATLTFQFRDTNIGEGVKNLVSHIFRHREDYTDLTLIGFTDERLETILNVDEIVTKVVIKVTTNEPYMQLNPNEVSSLLINKIREYET